MIGIMGSAGQVWCLEADGHLNLEPGPACSRLPLQTLPASPSIAKEAQANGQCLTCLDLPVVFLPGIGSDDLRLKAPSGQISESLSADFVFSSPLLVKTAFSQLKSPQSFHTTPSLRTVILII